MKGITNESYMSRESNMGSEHIAKKYRTTVDGVARMGEAFLTMETPVRRTSAESEGHLNLDPYASVTPYVGMEFESEEAARIFYDEYAWRTGFSIRTNFRRRSKRDGTTIGLVFVCSKEGFRRSQYPSKRRPTREGCKALISVKKADSGKWVVVKFVEDHTHALVSPKELSLHESRGARVGEIDATGTESEGLEILDPHVGMEFESEKAARIFYYEYGKNVGFGIRTNLRRRSKRNGKTIGLEFVCSKEGFRRKECKNMRRPTREGCKAMIRIKKATGAKWAVTRFVKDHNHELGTQEKVPIARSRRRGSNQSGRFNNIGALQDHSNYIRSLRERVLGREAQYVLEYFKRMQAKNASFFYAIHADKEYNMTNFFWADARSRMAYTYFGDVVTFDTSYRMNQHGVPFAHFIGVNHHKQPVLLGCALMIDETEASFVWLFNTWLEAMSEHHPFSLITDQDPAIEAAVAKVFPRTRHRFCKRDISSRIPEKLGNVECRLEDFIGDFSKCINLTELNDEFESVWQSLIDKYKLGENEWLSSLYKSREQWVQVYLHDESYGDSIGSLFNRYMSPHNSLQMLLNQCEKAVDSQYEKELEEDFKTSYMKPILKTELPMENQVAEVYTRTIFMEFQEQLFQSLHHTAEITKDGPINTLRVVEFGVEKRAYTVTFDVSEVRASCSCQMFEYTGILCRHVLRVFSMKSVMKLPSHYILKRWSKNATSGSDERDTEMQGSYQDSWTFRYNDLCRQAIKYAGEAATTINIYSVAMRALRKAYEEVDAAKETDGIVMQPGYLGNGVCHQDNVCAVNLPDNVMVDRTLGDRQYEKTKGHPSSSTGPTAEEQRKKKRKCQICKYPDHDKRKCPYSRSAGANSNIVEDMLESQRLHSGMSGEQLGFSDNISVVHMGDNNFFRYV
ncbi:protein FAR1-RELATED SEQUENCE 5-like [Magnolia sinica]|uniref:protein FAR1-RELATED SEQUENCE 5-like n=1 Tax=Magnolia sinica TaxID=86752 RepID=UPI0026596714|nr:protein FAR1-RELATED SEQUENCE 5-like [Magnolia sinica]XP_058113502.1 protein FAR1-RELATED SEQUENCE 5-like [Magnolia sinica]XP_058113503.1 protein FAR1-RELATED SEQUENCE 5-like [Magnolia sinica]XP_058113504.1 protein FAR1-RELATED SEQUENCE 5-like [Magnolia sinica]